MNKAKALFALGVIAVVAAASGALWWMNESGRMGTDEPEVTTSCTAEATTQQSTTQAPAEETTTAAPAVSEDEINNFLTTFSNVYFAEGSGSFDSKNAKPYELLLFAFLHTKNTDRAAIMSKKEDDAIGSYMGISIEKANEVLDSYLGLVVDAESVYTENDYEFFRYEDGCFWTPAADGVGYSNYCIADSVVTSGDSIIVQFTVFSGTEKYASGEARIKTADDGFRLDLYKIRY